MVLIRTLPAEIEALVDLRLTRVGPVDARLVFAVILAHIGVVVHGLVEIKVVLLGLRRFGRVDLGVGDGIGVSLHAQQVVELHAVVGAASAAAAVDGAGFRLHVGNQVARLLLGLSERSAVYRV